MRHDPNLAAIAVADRHRECADSTPAAPALTAGALIVFAVVCGLSVANIYYAQPLLDAMAADLHIGASTIGIVVTLTQIGYAIGLILIVPLGDLIDPRHLVIVQGVLSSIALAVVGLAPTAAVVLAGMVFVGLLAVVVQVLVAFTATLSVPAERGRNVGFVTSGVVVGILLARLTAGILADIGGWRSVYLTSAAVMLAMSIVLARILPRQQGAAARTSYAALVWSTPRLFAEEPLLRVRAALAFLIFASFSTLWTSLVLPLSSPPLRLSHTQIGLFGLAGLAGALAASGAGRLADRGLAQAVTGGALAMLTVSWACMALLPVSLAALVIGVVLLDLAVQAVHVTNQSLIFTLRPEARSRLVAGYMAFYSLGSATGSIAATATYAFAGWTAVCLVGAAFGAAGLLVWAMTLRTGSTPRS